MAATIIRYALVASLLAISLRGADPVAVITAPLPYQVVQRKGFDPLHAHVHAIGGPQRGYADVRVSASFPDVPDATPVEYRVVALKDAFGHGSDWAALDRTVQNGKVDATIRVAAGGWYRLELRSDAQNVALEPFGVGEVFIIAGQSYAAGANEEHQKVEDPQGRVVLYDWAKDYWRVADDPFPNMSAGGTIWPPFANCLLPLIQVPIGLIDVAVGATSSVQWLPGSVYHSRLVNAARTVGNVRAVFWQQGESDVIAKTPTSTYVKNLIEIHDVFAHEAGYSPPWLLAKSTLHLSTYNHPVEEQAIRDAIDELWTKPGFLQGPDTDILGGENRGLRGTRGHFLGIGQKRAGLMWFACAWALLRQPTPDSGVDPNPRQEPRTSH
jgi:hypothetical protein